MKKSVLLALFVAFTANLMAQSVALSESFSNFWYRRFMITDAPAGQDADNLYYFAKPRVQSKKMTDYVLVVDKNTMQASEIAISITAKYSLLDGIVTGNNIIALYNSLNKKGDQVIFSIANIDKSDKTVTLDDNNSVSTSANPKYWPEYKCAKSPDGKMLATLVMVTGKDNRLENLFAVVVNDQGEFAWSGPVTPDFGGQTFSLGNLTVDNEGNLCIPAYTCQMKGNNISNVNLMVIKANGDGTNSFTQDINFGTPQDFTSKILKDGNLAVAGYFTDSKTNTATKTSGYFFYKFDISSESFGDINEFRFDDKYAGKDQWVRFSNILGNQQYAIHADDIYELEDGSLALCGEHRFLKFYTGGTSPSYYQLLTKNILVSKFMPDGTALFTMIEKQQTATMAINPSEDWTPVNISYTAFTKGNDIYFLFNDDQLNIPYPGKGVVFDPSGMGFKKKGESVLMHLTPDMKLTQRIIHEPNQMLRGVEFVDGDYFYASGLGKNQLFLNKYSINE